MTLHLWFGFFAATIVLSVSPGSGAINTMSNGMRYGALRAIPGILGLQVGLALTVAVVGVGLGAVIASSTTAFTLLKWLGVGYLFFLGYAKWTDREPLRLDTAGAPEMPHGRMFWQAVLVNITNPKSIVFLVALFPHFIDPSRPALTQFVILGATMVLVDTVVMIGYAALAARLRRWVQSERATRLRNRVFGGLFMGAGGLLATVE